MTENSDSDIPSSQPHLTEFDSESEDSFKLRDEKRTVQNLEKKRGAYNIWLPSRRRAKVTSRQNYSVIFLFDLYNPTVAISGV